LRPRLQPGGQGVMAAAVGAAERAGVPLLEQPRERRPHRLVLPLVEQLVALVELDDLLLGVAGGVRPTGPAGGGKEGQQRRQAEAAEGAHGGFLSCRRGPGGGGGDWPAPPPPRSPRPPPPAHGPPPPP